MLRRLTFAVLASIVAGTTSVAPCQGKASDSGGPASVVCWVRNYNDGPIMDVVSDGDRIYVIRSAGRVQALNGSTGEIIWSAELGGEAAAQPVSTQWGLAVLTIRPDSGTKYGSGNLRLLSATSGVPIWSGQVSASAASTLMAAGDSLILIGTGVESFRASTGKSEWTAAAERTVTASLLMKGGRLLIGTADGSLIEVSLAEGRIVRSRALGTAPTALFSFQEGPVVVGDASGRIFAIDPDGQEIRWDLRNGARISSVAASGEWAIAMSYDNFVYALSTGGNIRWKRRLSGRLTGTPAISDSAVVVPAANEGTVYVIDPANGKVLDRIRMYDEGVDGKISARTISGDRFVISDSDTVRIYAVGACGLNEKKQP
jgi:outer membrane protein assembly factor BamB